MNSDKTLCIYTLGRFYVKRGSEIITVSSQKAKKRWNLFQILFSYLDQGLSHNNMIKYLDLNINTNPAEALKSLIYYLRKELKEDNCSDQKNKYIITQGGIYSFNKQSDYWLDAEVFESLYNKAKYYNEIDNFKAVDFYKQAIEMYHGDYLIEVGSQPWVLPVRSHYRNIYLHSLVEVSQLLQELKKYEKIIELCEKGLKINPYEEKLLLLILQALIDNGYIGEARIRYEEFKAFFDQNNLELSSEIKKIGVFIQQNKKELITKNKSDNIFLDLLEYKKRNSPLFCNDKTFLDIYSFEKSKIDRNNGNFFVVKFSFPKNLSVSVLNKSIINLEKVLSNNIRKSDVVCKSGERNILVLLTDLNKIFDVEYVNTRIINKFNEIEKNINLDIGINLISSS